MIQAIQVLRFHLLELEKVILLSLLFFFFLSSMPLQTYGLYLHKCILITLITAQAVTTGTDISLHQISLMKLNVGSDRTQGETCRQTLRVFFFFFQNWFFEEGRRPSGGHLCVDRAMSVIYSEICFFIRWTSEAQSTYIYSKKAS